MKYVLVFVLLTCVLSASIKERIESAAAERTQETSSQHLNINNEADCVAAGGYWWVQIGEVCATFPEPLADPFANDDNQ